MSSLYDSIHAPKPEVQLPIDTSKPDDHIEFATSDLGLIDRLRTCRWLRGKDYKLPVWLNTVPEMFGIPSSISANRLNELRDGAVPKTEDERRLIRNRAVVKQIAADIKREDYQYVEPPRSLSQSDVGFARVQERIPWSRSLSQSDIGTARAQEYNPRPTDNYSEDWIELANSDHNLKIRLQYSDWLRGQQYALPDWMDPIHDIVGYPMNINGERIRELREGAEPLNNDEHRLIRNRAVFNQITEDLHSKHQEAAPLAPIQSAAIVPPVQDSGSQSTEKICKDWIELAGNDQNLKNRLQNSVWLRGRQFKLPGWLDAVPEPFGNPGGIGTEGRIKELREGAAPKTDNEKRFVRNQAVVKWIAADLENQDGVPQTPSRPAVATVRAEDPRLSARASDPVLQSNLPPPPSTAPASLPTFKRVSNTIVLSDDEPTEDHSSTKDKEQTPFRDQIQSIENASRTESQVVAHIAKTAPAILTNPRHSAPSALTTFKPNNAGPGPSSVPQLEVHRLRKSETQLISYHQQQQSSQRRLATPSSPKQLHPLAPEFVPRTGHTQPPFQTANGSSADFRFDFPPPQRLETPQEEADRLRQTILAPFYQRIQQDSEEIVRLRQETVDMTARIEQHKDELLKLQQGDLTGNAPRGEDAHTDAGHNAVHTSLMRLGDGAKHNDVLSVEDCLTHPANEISQGPGDTPRGLKRKASPTSPMRLGDASNGYNEHTTEGHLIHLANQISKDLENTVTNETIHLCGLAPLKIMEQRPDDVLKLAHNKLHTWPYKHVPTCWRRLYEDASLSKAAQTMREKAEETDENGAKRRRLGDGTPRKEPVGSSVQQDWISEIVKTLDMGISLSGAPGRSLTFEAAFQQLENFLPDDEHFKVPVRFHIPPPKPLETLFPIRRANKALSFEAFQRHLDKSAVPLVIPGTLTQWPAYQKWHEPAYFLRLTLGGRRLVPVEVGKLYTDEGWSQTIMPFSEFMKDYLISKEPKDVGYLAQHDLFAQIPALREDITIPDYCYTTPPEADEATARTSGLSTVPQLDQPLLNAWFGPKGTKTPLHTDPYHNILCQVVGYKYIRLYAPSETAKLYPHGMDARGVSLDNTSQVDVSHSRSRSLGGSTDLDAIREQRKKFPMFQEAKFEEVVLGPGECLYVPLGWWHFVESLSTSFSVSFWWN